MTHDDIGARILPDAELFAAEQLSKLRQAVVDLCWLLSRGYNLASLLKLAGDRYDFVSGSGWQCLAALVPTRIGNEERNTVFQLTKYEINQ